MGCSPSKDNNVGTLGPFRKSRMLPLTPPESCKPPTGGEKGNLTMTTDLIVKDRTIPAQSQVTHKETPRAPQKKKSVTDLSLEAVNMDKLHSYGLDDNTVCQGKERNNDKLDAPEKKSVKKTKKIGKGAKVPKKKDKCKILLDNKVDFPEPLITAHQEAYAFLNPSINKYDVLLGLLEQATETRLSMRPMVAFMVLRYEEIIHGLEEIAAAGEKVLKDNGGNLAWTSQMKNLSPSSSLKSDPKDIEPPPDLLQQLLQYTTQRMKNVSQTVGGLGDAALEETVEYFDSLSELLQEKLKAKRAAEARLMQLLTCIELASLRKPGSEDCVLFSEDSGIGAESESLAGSERHRRRESSESTQTNRATPVSHTENNSSTQDGSEPNLSIQKSPSVSLTSLNSLGSFCAVTYDGTQRNSLFSSVSFDDGDEDENNNEEDEGMQNVHVRFRNRSNSSPIQSRQQPCRQPSKRIKNPENIEMTLKMKNAISRKIQFVPGHNTNGKSKLVGSPKTSKNQWKDDKDQSPQRPQTATPDRKARVKKKVAGQQRSQSAESLRSRGEDPTLLELERTQKDLNQRLRNLYECDAGVNVRTVKTKQNQGRSLAYSTAMNSKQPSSKKQSNIQPPNIKADLTKRTNKKQGVLNVVDNETQKAKSTTQGPVKATPPHSPPPTGPYRGRSSVKKLIDTFSQGIEEHESPKNLGPLKGVRKCGVPVLPGIGNMEAVLSTGLTSCRPDNTLFAKTNDLDSCSLPPPSLEVLMDNSFESLQGLSTGGANDGTTKLGKSLLKRTVASQKLRSSLESVTVLPSKGSLPQASKAVSVARCIQLESSAASKFSQPDVQSEDDPLCHKTRKVIHIKNTSDSQTELRHSLPSGQKQCEDIEDGSNLSRSGENAAVSTESLSSAFSGQSPFTQPKSKSRLLPSTPTKPTSVHQNISSPNFKRQPTPPTSSSPALRRKPTTPPAAQRRLPSPPFTKQSTQTVYPLKTPCPPASPKVQRQSTEKSSDDSSSVRVTGNACSVFCPISPSLFEAQSRSIPCPTQAWTSAGVSYAPCPPGSQSRFPVSVQGPRPFLRRSHSDRRPSLNLHRRSPCLTLAETFGSEPAIFSHE